MFPDATLLPVAEGMPPTNSALRLRVGRRMSSAVAVAETICRGADAPQVSTPSVLGPLSKRQASGFW